MQKIGDIFEYLMSVLDNLIYLLVALALLGFLWGVLKYIKSSGDPKGLDEAKKYIVYGLLSLLVITSLWSFVFLLGHTFGVNLKSNYLQGIDSGGDGTDGNFGDPAQTQPFRDTNDLFNNDDQLFAA